MGQPPFYVRKETTLKRYFLMSIMTIFIASAVAASPRGGRIADLLYANSFYGLAHPLPQLPLTPYALSTSGTKKKRGEEIVIGTLGNALVPGFGSLLIGDPKAPALFTGYGLSLLAVTLGIEVIALGSVGHQQPAFNVLPWEILSGVGLSAAAFFYIWGIFSPIHYVRHNGELK